MHDIVKTTSLISKASVASLNNQALDSQGGQAARVKVQQMCDSAAWNDHLLFLRVQSLPPLY